MTTRSNADTPTKATAVPETRSARMRLRFGSEEWLVDASRPTLTFGRTDDNDVVIDSGYVSRRHASVQHRNGKLYLADESTNGTYVVRPGADVLYVHDETAMLEAAGRLELGRRGTGVVEFATEVRGSEREAWSASPAVETATTSAPADNLFRREGDYWTIAHAGNVFRLRDSKGLRFIAQLIRDPGRELHALDLALEGLGAASTGAASGAAEYDLTVSRGESVGPMLDATAKAAYKRRIGELREELATAERLNDTGTAARAREEIDFLGEQLSAAVGLGGRDRETGAHAERARVLVTVRIKSAIKKIEQCDPSLGHHLTTMIKTGRFCSYNPDPRRPLTWTL